MKKYAQSHITILAFEGPDKSGKSTLIRKLNEATQYRFLCIDRFTGSAWVYDKLFKRRNRASYIIKTEEELNHLKETRVINILLKCNPDVLRKRIESEDEHRDLRIKQLLSVISLYDTYSKKIARLPTIEVDTSTKTVDETVQEILAKIEEHEQNDNR